MSSNNKLKVFTNGILNENPVLVLVLGTCPTLATSTMAANGIGMGLAATAVLILPILLAMLGIEAFEYVLLNPILVGNL